MHNIMEEKDLVLLKELSEVYGISGHEKKVRDIMKREFLKYVKEEDISYDGLGSIIAKSGTKGIKFALSGHMDEIGFVVTNITSDGYLKFQSIGGWNPQVLSSQLFKVVTKDDIAYTGVIGSIPPHLLSEEEKAKGLQIDNMFLDIGAASESDVKALGIQIGDMIVPNTKVEVLPNGDFLLGKAWDNRIGCAIVLKVLQLLKEDKDYSGANTVYAIGSTQEEVGCRGAKTASNKLDIDIAIALDVTIAKDTIGADKSNKLGLGPCILVIDGGLIGHVALREYALKLAKDHKIKVQVDYLRRGSTDASQMSLSGSGALSMSLCLPARYIHSHASIISYSDFLEAARLIKEMIKNMDKETFEKLAYE